MSAPLGMRLARRILGATLVVTLVAGAAPDAGVAAAPPAVAAPAGDPTVRVADQAARGRVFQRLAEADALLRRGRPRAAARAFREVVEQAPGTPWGTLAELGLAWSVATSGDVELGRALAADAHAAAGATAPTTSIVLGLLSARAGDQKTALALLDGARALLDGTMRTAADAPAARAVELARAYVLFWSGDLARAAAAFDALAAAVPDGPLADDARYGAAWSRQRAGEEARAQADLAALVADAPPGHVFRSVPRRLVELDVRAIIGVSARRHRRAAVQSPEAELARLLDGDGFSRARAALRTLAAPADTRRNAASADAPPAGAFDPVAADARGGVAGAPRPPAAGAPRPATGPRRTAPPLFGALLLLIAVAVALAWRLRARASRARRSLPRGSP